MHRVGRLLPLLAAALLLGLLGTGSFALATSGPDRSSGHERHSGDQSGRQGGHKGDGGNTKASDQQQRSGNKDCGDGGYSAWDEEWLKMSIQGDLFEIQGGNLAQQKATTQLVRDLGARLVKDHTKSLHDAVDVAERLGIDVPDKPSPSQQWQLRAVAQFKGADFDRWYSDLEVQDHIQDIEEAQAEVDKGCNHDIKQLAEDDLPVLKQHLELARAALAAAGGTSDSNDDE
jgi:putative membrane protein